MSICKIKTFTIDHKNLDRIAEVDGFSIPYDGCSLMDFSLEKKLLQPNELTFTLRRNAFKDGKKNAFSMIENIIGKEVECEVDSQPFVGYISTLKYKGIVDKVSAKGMNLTCVAHTPDAKMQGAPKCRCFTNVKLEDVVNAVVPGFVQKKVDIHHYFQSVVFPYIIQYNESDYDFLVRLAKRFGAFMYYGQNQFFFGKLTSQPNQIIAQHDIQKSSYSANYEIQTGDPNIKFEGFYYEKNLELKYTGRSGYNFYSPEKLVKAAAEASEDFNADSSYRIDDPNSYHNDPGDDFENFYSWVTMGSDLNNLVTCTFSSYFFNLEVGDVVTINDNGPMLVTSLHLTWDCNGSANNEITAKLLSHDNMDADDVYPPYMDFNAYPKSSAQRAVVTNNVDQKKMGRVQVRFVWQTDPNADPNDFPWIRIAQPYGGNKKGCYILPEIGEEVMVGFEHENMEKPFVIGTLFHNSDKDEEKQMPDESWVEAGDDNKENEVKAFRTKKGHTIEFHDTKEGDGFIRVYGYEKKEQGHEQDPPKPNYDIILSTDEYKDSSTNQYYKAKSADEGAKTGCDIKVKEDYEVKKLRIKVQSYGGDIMLDAGSGDIVLNAANIRVNATGNTTTHIGGKNIVKVDDAQLIDVGSHSFVVQKDQRILVTGEDKENYKEKANIVFSKDLAVTSDSLQMKTHHKTEVKAMDVELITDKSTKVKANTGLELDGGAKSNMKGGSVTIQGTTAAIVKSAKLTLGDDVGLTTIQGTTIELSPEISGIRKGTWTDM